MSSHIERIKAKYDNSTPEEKRRFGNALIGFIFFGRPDVLNPEEHYQLTADEIEIGKELCLELNARMEERRRDSLSEALSRRVHEIKTEAE